MLTCSASLAVVCKCIYLQMQWKPHPVRVAFAHQIMLVWCVFLIVFQQSRFPCLFKWHNWQTVGEVISPKHLRYRAMQVQSKSDALPKE